MLLDMNDEWHIQGSSIELPSHVQSHQLRFPLLCPGGFCRWCGGARSHSPGVSHWPPQWWVRWWSRSVLACPLRRGAACPSCRPVSKSWRRGGRRRSHTSKRGGSKGEPGSRTSPWSSTGWCGWRPEQTVSVKRQGKGQIVIKHLILTQICSKI